MSNKTDCVIILDNGHGKDTAGKRSPDGGLLEYAYTRGIVLNIYSKLSELGYRPYILVPEEEDISLNTRVKRANKIYKDNNNSAILVSVHCNAAGSDNLWHSARGWCVFVSQNASSNSIHLADSLKSAAEDEGLKIRLLYPNKSYWVQSLAICRDTNCPAVLTENLFLDNKEDVEFLLSDAGKQSIIDLHVNGIIKYLS